MNVAIKYFIADHIKTPLQLNNCEYPHMNDLIKLSTSLMYSLHFEVSKPVTLAESVVFTLYRPQKQVKSDTMDSTIFILYVCRKIL